MAMKRILARAIVPLVFLAVGRQGAVPVVLGFLQQRCWVLTHERFLPGELCVPSVVQVAVFPLGL